MTWNTNQDNAAAVSQMINTAVRENLIRAGEADQFKEMLKEGHNPDNVSKEISKAINNP